MSSQVIHKCRQFCFLVSDSEVSNPSIWGVSKVNIVTGTSFRFDDTQGVLYNMCIVIIDQWCAMRVRVVGYGLLGWRSNWDRP